MFFKYFSGSNPQTVKERKSFVKPAEPKKPKVYVVAHVTSDTILGVYSDLEKAKEEGNKSTKFNYRVYEFTLDDLPCYYNPPVFEQK